MNQEIENVEGDAQKQPERKSIEDEIGYFASFLSVMYGILFISILLEVVFSPYNSDSMMVLSLEIGLVIVHRYFSQYLSFLKPSNPIATAPQWKLYNKIQFKWIVLLAYVLFTTLAVIMLNKTSLEYGSWYLGIQSATIIPFGISIKQCFNAQKKTK